MFFALAHLIFCLLFPSIHSSGGPSRSYEAQMELECNEDPLHSLPYQGDTLQKEYGDVIFSSIVSFTFDFSFQVWNFMFHYSSTIMEGI